MGEIYCDDRVWCLLGMDSPLSVRSVERGEVAEAAGYDSDTLLA